MSHAYGYKQCAHNSQGISCGVSQNNGGNSQGQDFSFLQFQTYYSTPEIIIKSTDDAKFDVIEKVKRYCISQEYKVNDIDGVRVEFDNGWALVRASNTGPNITARFEGKTEEDMNNIKNEFMSVLNDFIS